MKRLLKLLYPSLLICILLIPIAVGLTVYSLTALDGADPIAIASYVIAAYTLAVWCVQVPRLIRAAKAIKRNKYAVMLSENVRLRVCLVLGGGVIWNLLYAILQLAIGVFERSLWFCSIAVYYACLAGMRAYLLVYTGKHLPGENRRAELVKYRACGSIFFVLNVALAGMIFFMVYKDRTFEHGEITTIAMAAYSFVTFTMAIVNAVKYRKYNSPVFSASKNITLASVSVSMLTLTSTMLTTFGEGEVVFRKYMLATLGGAVSAFVVTMAIWMIVSGTKQLKKTFHYL